jgi:subtilisin family serine protease
LRHPEIRSEDSPVSSVVVNQPVLSPEFGDALIGIDAPVELLSSTADPQAFIDWLKNFLAARPARPEIDCVKWLLHNAVPANKYLDGLGIGNLSRFSSVGGSGTSVCVLDSGADESHPMLQTRIAGYERFDMVGQFKEAYASVDAGCHGTKVCSIVSGQAIELHALGIDERRLLQEFGLDPHGLNATEDMRIQCGVAPGSRAFAGGILNGMPGHEAGTLASLLSGLSWAAETSPRNYCCVVASAELSPDIPEVIADRISRLIGLIQEHHGIPVLAAAGNYGENSRAISRSALVIGSCNRNGEPSPSSGAADVYATGTDVLCAQPQLREFNNSLIGLHSGSSFATALVAGCVCLLCSTDAGKQLHQRDIVDLLIDSAAENNRVVNIDIAYEKLLRRL